MLSRCLLYASSCILQLPIRLTPISVRAGIQQVSLEWTTSKSIWIILRFANLTLTLVPMLKALAM